MTLSPSFSGRVSHTVDDKKRVTLPARWRQGEADEFYVVPDPTETFLRIMTPVRHRQVAEDVKNSAVSPKERTIFMRYFSSNSVHVVADKQGRLLLPMDHCELLGLKGELIFVGVTDMIEVWNKQRWDNAHSVHKSIYLQVGDAVGL